ncbi:MAG TPA: RNA polymerase sigma factor [Anaerolineales bacterium]|nr:RNA polymerase sigma factor [Anaerolineales bacterium]
MKVFEPRLVQYIRMITMDYRLIELCRVGDSSAIENFVQTYQQDVYRLALSILDDPSEADDATQESLLAALRALGSFHGDSSLKTWLYSITVNVCRNRIQRHRRHERLTRILGEILRVQSSPSVEEDAIQNASNEALWRVIRSMDEKHRIPVVLRYYHDLSVAEIAHILQVPEGTVHSRLNTARRQLHHVLKEGRL